MTFIIGPNLSPGRQHRAKIVQYVARGSGRLLLTCSLGLGPARSRLPYTLYSTCNMMLYNAYAPHLTPACCRNPVVSIGFIGHLKQLECNLNNLHEAASDRSPGVVEATLVHTASSAMH